MARFLISPAALERNARILRQVGDAGGARMLVALKAFACTAALETVRPYADGYCASGLYEARLAQNLGGEVAVFSPAYREEELRELLDFAAHIDFNSVPQWLRFRETCLAHPRAKSGEVLFGLRINPCHSTGHTPLYDPCVPGSRLGIPPQELEKAGADALRGISGLHIHTLCEQGAQELVDTFRAFEKSCAHLLQGGTLRYLNLGGGHWITKPFYDRPVLIALLQEINPEERLNKLNGYFDKISSGCEYKHWYFASMHEDKSITARHTCVFKKLIPVKFVGEAKSETVKDGNT